MLSCAVFGYLKQCYAILCSLMLSYAMLSLASYSCLWPGAVKLSLAAVLYDAKALRKTVRGHMGAVHVEPQFGLGARFPYPSVRLARRGLFSACMPSLIPIRQL